MKPKKLIREKIISKLKDGEFENITDLKELNKPHAACNKVQTKPNATSVSSMMMRIFVLSTLLPHLNT